MQFHDVTTGLLALGAVLGLIWLVQRTVRGLPFVRTAPGGRLRLVQSLAIDPRRRIVLVQCDGDNLVLLTGGPNDILLLANLPRPELIHPTESRPEGVS